MATQFPLFQTTSFKDNGALGGFLAGMNDSFALANADRDLVDRDMKTELERIKLEEERLNTPLKAVERANKLAEAENTQSDWQSGRRKELLDAENAAKLQEAISKKSDAEVKHMYNQATGTASMASLFNDNDEKNPDVRTITGKWDSAVEIADRVGLKNFPRQYSPENLRKLRMMGEFAKSTIPYLQKKELVASDQAHDLKKQGERIAADKAIASGHDTTTLEAARIRATGEASAQARLAMKPAEQAYAEMKADHEKGKPVEWEKVLRYISLTKEGELQKAIDPLAEKYTNLFKTNPDQKAKLAKEFGLDPNTNEPLLGREVARRIVERDAIRNELSKFEGYKIQMPDGTMARVSGRELVPDKAAAPKPVAPAAAPSPAAPAAMPPVPSGEMGPPSHLAPGYHDVGSLGVVEPPKEDIGGVSSFVGMSPDQIFGGGGTQSSAPEKKSEPAKEEGIPVGTRRTVGGKTYEKVGKGDKDWKLVKG